MDSLTPERRSANMSKIRSVNTRPEMVVRSLLHRRGYRFRLHRNDLPGKPDIVLPKHKAIILIHGCFWHGHNCKIASSPKSNKEYWTPKILSNRTRDARNLEKLREQGWHVLILWECEIRKIDIAEERILSFFADLKAAT